MRRIYNARLLLRAPPYTGIHPAAPVNNGAQAVKVLMHTQVSPFEEVSALARPVSGTVGKAQGHHRNSVNVAG
jgi:hypothetical protein